MQKNIHVEILDCGSSASALGYSALIINLIQLLFTHKQKKGFQALGGTLVLMRQRVLVKYD